MAAFQDTREQTEQKVMVHLLSEIERNPSFTQRGLAGELNIALGLMNQYLKRCITKGWVRASQVSPRRITYFLTPEGFIEKSHMVKDYLARSMTFFKEARGECEEVLEYCKAQAWSKIALVGEGDLADIAMLVASGSDFRINVVSTKADLKNYDAVIITDVTNPQGTYNAIKDKVEAHRLLILNLFAYFKGGIMISWCVAHTQPLKEMVAQQHLLDQGYEVFMPRFKKTVRHARKVEEKLAPLFPRYIFVGMDLSVSRWRSITGTRGISYLLMNNGLNPAIVQTSVIEALRAQEVGDGIVPVASLVTFAKGEYVRIVEGAFKDQMAIFESMDDKSRVQLLLTFMGREMKMTLPTYAVEAA